MKLVLRSILSLYMGAWRNWSWVRVPPHPFLLNIKSFLGFRGRIPAGPRENTLKYNFKVHGRIKAREKSFDFSLAF